MADKNTNGDRIKKSGQFLINAFYLGFIANVVVAAMMIIAYIRPEIDIKIKCFYLSSVVGVTGNFLMISQFYFAGRHLIFNIEAE